LNELYLHVVSIHIFELFLFSAEELIQTAKYADQLDRCH